MFQSLKTKDTHIITTNKRDTCPSLTDKNKGMKQ